jgi:type IX secretion system PorP/SprF family membrane protein
MKLCRLFLSWIALLFFLPSMSQDLGFSQYYNAPIFLNPAFTGTSEFTRVGLNYRMQKVGSLSAYNISQVSLDHSFKDYHSSVGLMVFNEVDEASGYTHNKLALPLCYDFSVSKNMQIRFGLEGSYSQQNFNVGNFIFSDQLDAFGNITSLSAESLASGKVNYFDASFGVLGYSKELWFGFAAHNLFKNNISFMEGSEYQLKTRFSGHMGYRYRLKTLSRQSRRNIAIMPTFSFTSQGPLNRLDVGMYNVIDPVIIGVFYGTDPFAFEENNFVSLMIGLKKNTFTTIYSYDLSLTQGAAMQGFHEISFSYLFELSSGKPPLSMRRTKCPVFL